MPKRTHYYGKHRASLRALTNHSLFLRLCYILLLTGYPYITIAQQNSQITSRDVTKPELRTDFLSPQTLNSERIRIKFGTYGIRVLYADSLFRVADLYSGYAENAVTRTFAMTSFSADMDTLLWPLHQKIVAGASIGETFKSEGWSVEKQGHMIGQTNDSSLGNLVPAWSMLNTAKAFHYYQFWAVKDAARLLYAEILEIHHPDFLRIKDLMQMFPSADHSSGDHSMIKKHLQQARFGLLRQ